MRVAIVTPGFNADECDWCIPALRDLVTELSKNHDICVVTVNYPDIARDYHISSVPVHALAAKNSIEAYVRSYRLLQRLDGTEPFDLIHVFFAGIHGAIAALVGKRLRKPIVLTVMGGELVGNRHLMYGGHLRLSGRIGNWVALRLVDRLVTLSPYASMLLPTGVRAKGDVISFGVDSRGFDPAGYRAALTGELKLLIVGSLVAVKGHALLIRALCAAGRPELTLHVVGDGPLREELEQLVDRYQLRERIIFHGEVHHSEIANYYRAADCLIVSSFHETQCVAAVEAAMCGCAVAGFPVGILPELTSTDLLAERTLEGLHALLLRMSQCDLKARGMEALAVAREHYSLATSTGQIEHVYSDLVS